MRCVVAAVFVLACSSSGEPSEGKSSEADHGDHGERWAAFVPPDGSFHVELPGTPVARIQTTPGAQPTQVHAYLVDRGARGNFQVATYDLAAPLSGSAAETAAELDCTTPFSDGEFKVAAKHAQPLGTTFGYVVEGDAPISKSLPQGGTEEDRCFVTPTRMVHAMAIGPNTKGHRADAARFFASLALPSP